MIISAGPEAKAEAMKRRARRALCQNGRALLEDSRNAVTVWMEMAQKMATMTKGK
jgi:hypothetical protein